MAPQSQPLVSIITPTYNHGRFIRSCVQSALQQSYGNWEQIIVDDGSVDNTAAVIAEFDDPRVRYQRQNHRGAFELGKTYNHALAQAQGDLIAILEGDDFWPADKLAALVPAFEAADVVLAYGEAVDVDADGRRPRRASSSSRLLRELPPAILQNDPVGSATRHMLTAEGRSLISPSTVILRRSALESLGGFQYLPGLPLTDYPTFLELSIKGKFHFSPRELGFRRRHGVSITVNHATQIHEMVSAFTLRFLEKHALSLGLSLAEQRQLAQNWRQAEDTLHFSEGRTLLLRRDWRQAGCHFRSALRSKRPAIRMAAVAGCVFAWLHRDMEFLMKLGGRATLDRAGDGAESAWTRPAELPGS